VRRRYPASAVALVTLAAIFIAWHAWSTSRAHADVAQPTAVLTPPRSEPERHAARVAEAARAVSDTREDSLRGTIVDGAVNFDASGHPLADRDLRRLFDYWLARLGERDIAQIRSGLLAHLRDVLRIDRAALAQLMTWFDLYVATGQSVAAAARTGQLDSDAVLVRALHEHYLGYELARAWFGADDDYAAYTAQRLALAHARDMSPAMRSQQLDELDASLDPAERDGRHAATAFQIAVEQTRQFSGLGADADTRYQERAAMWGDDAAMRLALLDDAQARWTSRAAAYARKRDAVLGDAALSAANRQASLDALLAGFSEPERRRLLSLAQANALP
jgi:lipase chaperone LimK